MMRIWIKYTVRQHSRIRSLSSWRRVRTKIGGVWFVMNLTTRMWCWVTSNCMCWIGWGRVRQLSPSNLSTSSTMTTIWMICCNPRSLRGGSSRRSGNASRWIRWWLLLRLGSLNSMNLRQWIIRMTFGPTKVP